MTFSHIDQLGSISTFIPASWIRKEAWPIQVMQISSGRTFGKSGIVRSPKRLVKNDGIRTSVRKLRLCQSNPGFRPTRVGAPRLATPFTAEARITLVRFFREKGVGTAGQRYKLTEVKQLFCGTREWRGNRAPPPNENRPPMNAVFPPATVDRCGDFRGLRHPARRILPRADRSALPAVAAAAVVSLFRPAGWLSHLLVTAAFCALHSIRKPTRPGGPWLRGLADARGPSRSPGRSRASRKLRLTISPLFFCTSTRSTSEAS